MEPISLSVITLGVLGYMFTVGTNIFSNFLTDELQDRLRNPQLDFLWKRYCEAFFSSFDLYISDNKFDNIKFRDDVKKIKKVLQIYYDDENTHFHLARIFIKHTGDDFKGFLSKIKSDASFRTVLAEDIIQERLEYRDNPNKDEVIQRLSEVLAYFYEAFVSSMSDREAHNQLFTFAIEHQELLKDVYQSIQELIKKTTGNQEKIENLFKQQTNELKQDLKTQTKEFESTIAPIADLLSTYLSQDLAKIDTPFILQLEKLPINRPKLIVNGSKRIQKVAEIEVLLEKYTWVNLQGINGTGKSQLANLVSRKFENYYWLDLKSVKNDINKSIILIEAFLATISQKERQSNREDWINTTVQVLPNKTLIVLNDLPATGENEQLNQLLSFLVNALNGSSFLLTTSNFKINSRVIDTLQHNSFNEYYDLNFAKEEIEEYLSNHPFDKRILKFVTVIESVSRGNTRIVGAIINYLKNLNPNSTPLTLFEDILRKKFSLEIIEDAQLAIQTIEDNEVKELLYRLSLIYWNFKFDEIQIVSNVPISIEHPNEKFRNLVDIWIQREEGNTYHISPLIQDIGKTNLGDEKIRTIYTKIGEFLLSQKRLDLFGISRTISCFIYAQDYNRAASVLINLYKSTEKEEEVQLLSEWSFIDYWTSTEMPKAIDVSLRIVIRNEQIRLYKIIGRDTQPLFKRLEEYYHQENLSTQLKSMLSLYFALYGQGQYLSHFAALVKNWDEITIHNDKKADDEILVGLLWATGQYIETYKEVQEWISIAKKIENIVETDFWNEEIAATFITILSGKITKSEAKQHLGEKDRISLYDNLNKLDIDDLYQIEKKLNNFSEHFKAKGLEHLEAIIINERLNLKYRYDKDFEEVEGLGKSYLKKFKTNLGKYLIANKIGRLYYFEQEYTKSKKWLEKAVDTKYKKQDNYIDTLIYGASSFSASDTTKALEYCKQAFNLAETNPEIDKFDSIKIAIELGVAYWLNKDYPKCYETFKPIVTQIFELKETDFGEEWMRVFCVLGHILGYVSADVYQNKTLDKTMSGDDYTKPYQGMMYFNHRSFTEYYKEHNDPYIKIQISGLANGINNKKEACNWAFEGYELAKQTQNHDILMTISPSCMHLFIVDFDVKNAFESSLKFVYTTQFLKQRNPNKVFASYAPKVKNLIFEEIQEEKPSELWNTTEEVLVKWVVIPLFIELMNLHLNKHSDKRNATKRFFSILSKYELEASDKTYWTFTNQLIQKIITKKTSDIQLVNTWNEYHNKQHVDVRIVCALGSIFVTKNHERMLYDIAEIFPYIIESIGINSKSIIKYIYVPFVKNRCLYALKEQFCGQRRDLEKIIRQINEIKIEDKNAIQLILQPVIEELSISIEPESKKWLYSF